MIVPSPAAVNVTDSPLHNASLSAVIVNNGNAFTVISIVSVSTQPLRSSPVTVNVVVSDNVKASPSTAPLSQV